MEKNAMSSDTENVGKMWTLLIATRIFRFVMTSLVMKQTFFEVKTRLYAIQGKSLQFKIEDADF